MMIKKTTKKVDKKAPKMMKKKVIQTYYGVMLASEMKNIDSKGNMDVWLMNCKSDHINHAINSYMVNNKEESMKNTLVVKVEVLGQPMVKTTREITIKK